MLILNSEIYINVFVEYKKTLTQPDSSKNEIRFCSFSFNWIYQRCKIVSPTLWSPSFCQGTIKSFKLTAQIQSTFTVNIIWETLSSSKPRVNFKLYFKRANKYFGSPSDQLNADMMDAMDYFKVSDLVQII